MLRKSTTLIVAATSIALSACLPTTEGYTEVVNSYIGQKEVLLISNWGPPQRVYNSGGIKFLAYNNQRSMTIPGTAPTYQSTVIGNTVYTNAVGGTSPTTLNLKCETVYAVKDDIIVNVKFRGNDCLALPKKTS